MVGTATLHLCAALCLAALTLLLTACPQSKAAASLSADDLELLRGAQLISDALRAYQRETAELPGALRDAEPFLLRGEVWPVSPYSGQPVEQVDSAQFDGAASPGRIYYEKFMRDGMVVNYRLHVFGQTGVLKVLENTPGSLR